MRKLACIAVALAALARTVAAFCEEGDPPVVVWVASKGVEQDAVFPIAAAWLEELRILVVREEVSTPLGDLEAEKTLVARGAAAVVWHDASGELRVLFSGEESSERVSAAAGGTTEEGLYLRELIAARLAVGADLGAALVTVPEEIVEMRKSAVAEPPEPRIGARAQPSEKRRPWKIKVGGGYFASAHLDDVLWWQQGIRFALPALRPSDLVQAQIELELGLPSSIGVEDRTSLEISTVCASAGAGFFPLRGAVVEIEAGLNAGPLRTEAVAFLQSGESAGATHTTFHVTFLAGLVIHPSPRLDVRFRFDVRYVFRPPSFGILGEGDFGSHPWQPGGGIDLAFALFPR